MLVDNRAPLDRLASAAQRLAELDEPRLLRLVGIAELYVMVYDQPEMPSEVFSAHMNATRGAKVGAA